MTEQNLIVLSWGHIWGIIAGLFAVGAFFYKLLDKKFDKQESSIKEIKEKLSSFEKNTEHRLTKLEMETKNTNQRLTDFQGQVNQRLTTIEGYLVPRKVFHFEETENKDEPKEN